MVRGTVSAALGRLLAILSMDRWTEIAMAQLLPSSPTHARKFEQTRLGELLRACGLGGLAGLCGLAGLGGLGEEVRGEEVSG